MQAKFSYISRYAWVPIPLLIILIISVELSGNHLSHENYFLRTILNLIFVTLVSVFILHLLSRSFLISGKAGMVIIGCGALVWGFSGISPTIFPGRDSNFTITLNNLFIIFSAILYFAGATELATKNRSIRIPGLWLVAIYSIAVGIIVLIVLSAYFEKIPVFFIPNEGGTTVRLIVLLLSIILFTITGFVLRYAARGFLNGFTFWYSFALWLIAIGLTSLILVNNIDDILSWTGRIAQSLGGIYMAIAAVSSVKETKAWRLSVEDEFSRKSRLTEAALNKTRDRYRRIVELAAEALVFTDHNFYITEWNRAAELLYGWKADEVIGKNLQDVIRPSIGENELRALFDDGKSFVTFEEVSRRKDNSFILVETRVSVIRENDGSISGYIGLTHDITERKQTENELIRIKEDLERSKNHLNIALENANTGVWEWNLVVNDIRFDERIEKMFNIIPGSFHNTPEDFGELVHEEDTERVYGTVQNAIINDIPFEAVFRTRSAQTPRYLSARANIIKDKDGNKVSLIGVCFDVTGMMERYNQLITKLNEDLLKSNKELESFAYVASHDLQEPLRMVTSFTQLLQLRYHNKLDEDADTYINYAVDGSKRMYDLINGLLAYSRVNTRQKEFSQVDMNMVAEHAQENLKLRIEEKQAVIKCNKLPLIRADQNQMVQLLQNLIENGIKFSDRQPLITISANPENDHYVFSVSDNGIGIEKQYFERIFRIFQRLHLRDKYGGTGIGLSVCQRIVERHKGKIWVESEPGKGSTFLFTIPK